MRAILLILTITAIVALCQPYRDDDGGGGEPMVKPASTRGRGSYEIPQRQVPGRELAASRHDFIEDTTPNRR
jgi:hypothetical protein